MRVNFIYLCTAIAFVLGIHTSLMAQFVDLGPTGGPSYTAIDKPNTGDGTGQIHSIAFAPGYDDPSDINAHNVVFAGCSIGGLWISTDGGNHWKVVDAVQHLDLNSALDIAITHEKNYTIYIATGADATHWGGTPIQYSCGIYRSTDFGETFEPVTAFNTGQHFTLSDMKLTYQIAVSPFDPRVIFVGTSVGLFRSLDRGASWQNVFVPSNKLRGETPGIWSVAFSPTDSAMVYCAGDEVYRSSTLGAPGSFASLSNPLTKQEGLITANTYIKVTSADKHDMVYADVFAKYANSGTDNLYVYTGDTWTHLTEGRSGFGGVIASPDRIKFDVRPGNDTLIAGYTETYTTVNKGKSWTPATGYWVKGHGDIHEITFYPGGDSALVGTDGGIYKYRMHNNTVSEQNDGLAISYVWALSTSRTQKGKLAIGKQDTNDDWYDGEHWHQLGVQGDGYAPLLWDRTMDSIFYFFNGAMLFSYDIKNNRKTINPPGCINLGNYDQRMMQGTDPDRDDEIITTSTKGISHSEHSPRATNFELIDTLPQNWIQARRLYISSGDPDHVYAWTWVFDPSSSGNFLYRFDRSAYTRNTVPSKNCKQPLSLSGNGDAPAELRPLDEAAYSNKISCEICYAPTVSIAQCFPVSDVAVSNTNTDKIWVAFDYLREKMPVLQAEMPGQEIYRMRRSTDGGSSWQSDADGLPQMPVSRLIYVDGSNDMLICATVNGRVFYKDASMSKWTELDPRLPHTYITSMEINYCQRRLYVGMYGRGVWMYDLSAGTSIIIPLKISRKTKWLNKNLDIACDIDIPSGATLNISGSSLNMAKGTKITVEKGGTLKTSDKTKLFNSCGEDWGGIVRK